MENLYNLVGNTELFRLKNIEKAYGLNSKLFIKLEYQNPSGSIKDRPALYMLLKALEEGKIEKGGTVIEATSGNTGIGIAYFAKILGLKAVIVMPDTMTLERRALIQKYGGEVVLTQGKLGMDGSVKRAEEINKSLINSFIAGQFENPNNPLSHYFGTANEILNQTDNKIDIFVAGIGTGGTVSGIGKRLKEFNKNIQIIGMEPFSSPLLTLGKASSHKIPGIGANFIPRTLNRRILDEIVTVTDESASIFRAKLLALEGLDIGFSSGANVAAMAEIAKRSENAGKTIVTVAPDGGDRYPQI